LIPILSLLLSFSFDAAIDMYGVTRPSVVVVVCHQIVVRVPITVGV
jgi:hypothetical protein